jgi:curved DNA binding protein
MDESKPSFEEQEDDSPDLSSPEVVDKYKASADVANRVMQQVIQACQPGKKIAEICIWGDKLLEEYTSSIFSKVKRGIAFPTCISVNNCCGHFSPFPQDPTTLKEGDVVKVDLGAHIDGYISVCAHTFICGQTPEKVVTGRTADVICAAYFASECALKLMRPGKTNQDVTAVIQRVADVFKCKPGKAGRTTIRAWASGRSSTALQRA